MSVSKKKLSQVLQPGKLVVAPGVYDLISVRIASQMNFDCLYMTGYGTVASYLGLPDAGLATLTDMANRVSAFCSTSHLPIICDGDTGYGGLLNVAHTVRTYEQAGASAIQLEDQEFPKKCGHTPSRRVIPAEEMEKKIRVAVEARTDKDFLIIARTDARTSLGLDEALRRAERYAEAGADILFVESPETEAELRKIGETFDKPLLVNLVESGRTPILPPNVLQEMGFSIAIYPALGFLSAGHALRQAYSHLETTSTSLGLENSLHDFKEFNLLMGFQEVWDFDKQHAD
ncbi:isocitrate lyase/PEP mutase family protein [Pollutimonas harenae]|uniref:Isocitrate lyase/PEP mutase family protein n=1 Tax=Pollutimonas harenae TaxID=657015 RepID=A0A853H0I6_9BURK|nr:isocitrate lyase/PEP mutase family protein [Pollutimonas harenae]NYT84785.1 isocitrate lyase/PEP mutase family protein [Pollutimonas harenae]TEA72816.1 isocitrate lyase/PEP mutase family protein [Pollutimonas harenae]